MFEQILASIPDGIIVFDASEQITYINPSAADILSVDRRQVTGKRFLEAARIVEIDQLLKDVRNLGKRKETEVTIFLPEEKTILANAGLLDQTTLMLVLRDISAMKRLENIRREFVANVSHELKTPLTAIRGYAETLLEGAIDDQNRNRQFLKKMLDNTDNLSCLLDDLLEISSLEARRKEVTFDNVDLVREIDRAIEMTSAKAKQNNISIIKNTDEEGCVVKGDKDQIDRAIINLLDNAINYSEKGSKIEVSCSDKKIKVRDFGVGIAPQHLSRIFERFYRVDAARSRSQGGTGLGLSIVKHIMELHGGFVTVESEQNKGSTFSLVFLQ